VTRPGPSIASGKRFLGFEYRRILSLRRKWRPYYAPKLKKRTALFEKLREIFRKYVSWPVEFQHLALSEAGISIIGADFLTRIGPWQPGERTGEGLGLRVHVSGDSVGAP
jgi:hypothetical protein